MIKKILQIGDERLYSVSEEVIFPLDQDTINLIQDLKETLLSTGDLGAGISAVQIGYLKRLFIAVDIDNISKINKAKTVEKLLSLKLLNHDINHLLTGIDKESLSLKELQKKLTEKLTYVIINPSIDYENEYETYYWEGCLSVGVGDNALYAPVARSEIVDITYFDESGKKCKLKCRNYFAHVVLHEIDHLNGILFLTRVKDLSKIWKSGDLDKYYAKHHHYPPFE